MRIIIAGSRTFENYKLLKYKCDKILKDVPYKEIVSGCAKGADRLGEQYAEERGYDVHKFPADWDKYGNRAGHIRNEEMAKFADSLILFWDGKSKGSASMLRIATEYGLNIRVIKFA